MQITPSHYATQSKKWHETRDIDALEALCEALPALTDSPSQFNELLWNIKRLLDIHTTDLTEEQHSEVLYHKLAPAYFDFLDSLATKLPPDQLTAGQNNKVVIIMPVVLTAYHSPSLKFFGYASELIKSHGKEVLLINANSFPQQSTLDIHKPFIANTLKNFPELCKLTHANTEFLVYSQQDTECSLKKISDCLNVIQEFQPGVILAQSSFNVIADLASKSLPTIAIRTTHLCPVSLAHGFVDYQTDKATGSHQFTPPYERPCSYKPYYANLGAGIPLLAKTHAGTFNDYAFDEGDFVVTLVGSRLLTEVTQDLIANLNSLALEQPNLFVQFAGVSETDLLSHFQEIDFRYHCIANEKNLRGLFELCNVFLNPHRLGGGMSAYYALAEGLPILSLDYGDVARIAGAKCCFKEQKALFAELNKLLGDKPAYDKLKQQAIALAATQEDSFKAVIERLNALMTIVQSTPF